MSEHSEMFYNKIDEYYSNQNKKKPFTAEELKEIAAQILLARQNPKKKTRRQYHLLSLYDTLNIADRQIVIKKQKTSEDHHVSIVSYEDLFKILHETHISVGHGGRDKMIHALQNEYDIPRYAVEKLIETCEVCQNKRNTSQANLTGKSIISKRLNSRGQMDLIDFQSSPDDEYKWIVHYQDHATKFLFLRPLKSNTSRSVAEELVKIFLEIGAPGILQSENSKEFTNAVISELVKLWPMLQIVYGPLRPGSSVERTNQDVQSMLRAWMRDHKSTNWSFGCYFVQFQKNSSYDDDIGRTPYRALLGVDPKEGLSSEPVGSN